MNNINTIKLSQHQIYRVINFKSVLVRISTVIQHYSKGLQYLQSSMMSSQTTLLRNNRRSNSQPEKLQTMKLKVVNVFRSEYLPNQNNYIYVNPKHNAEYYKDIIDPSRRRSLYEIYKLEQKRLKDEALAKKIKSQECSVETIKPRKASSFSPLCRPEVLKEIKEKKIQNEIQRIIVQANVPLELISEKVKLMEIRISPDGKVKSRKQDIGQSNNYSSEFCSGVNKKWCAQHKKVSRTMCISKKFDVSESPWKISHSITHDDSTTRNY